MCSSIIAVQNRNNVRYGDGKGAYADPETAIATVPTE
jgi:hypothetical protein